jgi:hypothetical protein
VCISKIEIQRYVIDVCPRQLMVMPARLALSGLTLEEPNIWLEPVSFLA